MLNKEDLRFEIDQLRKDKMIYALESIAAFLAVLTLSFLIGTVFPTQVTAYIMITGFVLSILYWLFTVYGNTNRLLKIKKLEKQLRAK